VQRVPVRIALDPKELAEHPLRIGLSTTVTVDIHHTDGPVLGGAAPSTPAYKTDVLAQPLQQAGAEADRVIAGNL
jgi:membrane fusion protein (multidrug efflux system)